MNRRICKTTRVRKTLRIEKGDRNQEDDRTLVENIVPVWKHNYAHVTRYGVAMIRPLLSSSVVIGVTCLKLTSTFTIILNI